MIGLIYSGNRSQVTGCNRRDWHRAVKIKKAPHNVGYVMDGPSEGSLISAACASPVTPRGEECTQFSVAVNVAAVRSAAACPETAASAFLGLPFKGSDCRLEMACRIAFFRAVGLVLKFG